VTLAIGVVAIYAIPRVTAQDKSGDAVESYTVTLHSDGTLDETYVYNIVSRDTRFLFRFWEEVVTPSGSGYPSNWPHLEVISITPPPETTAYLKDDQGRVTIYAGTDSQTIYDLAYMDEVGAFNPNYYQPGKYTVSYKYRLYFPVDSDGSYDHLNIMFAWEHIPYSNVRIVLEDADKITAVYPHPPSLQITKSGSDYVITGSSAENELLEVEMLATSANSPWRSWGIIFQESNTKALTESANQSYSIQYWTAYTINLLSKAAVLLIPLLLLGFWFRFGREEDVTVPTYLSTVPNPDRKPWYVNLVYNKGMLKFDENGFYATLLDLDNRGKIKIEPREGAQTTQTLDWNLLSDTAATNQPTGNGSGLRIQILDTNVTDGYEKKVMEFLVNNSTSDPATPTQSIFDTETLNALATQISSMEYPSANALATQSALSTLMNPVESWAFKDEWGKIPKEQFIDNSRYLVGIAVLGVLFLVVSISVSMWANIVSYLMTVPAVLGIVILAQYAVTRIFPVFLMGRYRPGLYKEKLEWGAFRANLSDFSQMQKYGTEDLSMWGSWLVYGTALGVGDKVAQAMKSLNVKFVAASIPMVAHTHFYPLITARRKVVYTSSGGSSHRSGGGYHGGGHRGGGGGGGHGGGGGRGGGGAGRR
jgi:uncharacterized membrane protein